LNLLRAECGKAMAQMVAVAAGLLFLVFLVEGGTILFHSVWGGAAVGSLFVTLSAICGKIFGLRDADQEFRETATELAGILSGNVPRKSDEFAVLPVGRAGNADGFRLREQRV